MIARANRLRHTLNLRPAVSWSPSLDNEKRETSNEKLSNHCVSILSSSFSYSPNNIRHYHATSRKEILPVIAIGVVGVLGMYSFRALKRMDQEWDDYEEAKREYDLEHGIQTEEEETTTGLGRNDPSESRVPPSNNISSKQSIHYFQNGVMGIDLGTLNVRISHKGKNNDKPFIIVNREGARATPNYILFDTDGSFTTGKLAGSKLYERSMSSTPVTNTGMILRGLDDGNMESSVRNHMVQEVISLYAKDALEQAIGSKKISSNSLFTASESMGGYNVKPVFTYAPQGNNNMDFLDTYKEALKSLSLPDSISTFIAEPVSAIKAAKHHGLIRPLQSEPVMVIDVGGLVTSISIVQNEKILDHQSLYGFGGETLVESLMNYLSKSFYGVGYNEVQDKMGVQRLYDASKDAVMELSSGSRKSLGRVQINIPYLSVDEKMRPKHLDIGVSIKVLDAEFNDMIGSKVVPHYASKQGVLSSFTPNPNDLTGMISSMCMKVFESSGQNPFSFHSVLVVGGGARSPLIQSSIRKAFGTIAGEQFVQEKLVIPKDELIEELTVLGAAL